MQKVSLNLHAQKDSKFRHVVVFIGYLLCQPNLHPHQKTNYLCILRAVSIQSNLLECSS